VFSVFLVRMAASLQFSLSNVIDIKQKSIYSVKFCSILPLYKNYFAAVGMSFASLYRIGEIPGQVELEQAYTDSDSDENYFVREFADNITCSYLCVCVCVCVCVLSCLFVYACVRALSLYCVLNYIYGI
jgi:hypothetical protein